MKRSVSLIVLRYLRLSYALYGPSFWIKMIFFMKYFMLVHAPTWKIPQYMNCFLFICTRHRVRYLQLFFAICDSLMLCKVHNFGKRWFFHEIFQVVHAPTWKIPQYMKGILFISIYFYLCLVPSIFWKKMIFFMKYFKLVHAPTWKIPQYMNCLLFICTRHRCRYIQLFFAICDSLMLCKVHCFGKRWFFHEIFQVGACPNLKGSLIYENFSIHLYKTYKVRYLQLYWLSATPYSFARYIILEKDDFSWNIFQVGACPNLKDSFLYDRFSIHMYKPRIIRYLQQYSSICDFLMPCTVNFVEKDGFLMECFKLVHAPTWKIP